MRASLATTTLIRLTLLCLEALTSQPIRRVIKVAVWPEGHNPGSIQHPVTRVVVTFDVREVDRGTDLRQLIQRPCVVPEGRIFDQRTPIAFEVPVIDRIEANQRRKQADVSLGELIANEIAMRGQPLLEPVQGSENALVRPFVRDLRR